jgi:hypothetical protein
LNDIGDAAGMLDWARDAGLRPDRAAFPEEWKKGLRPRYFETNHDTDAGRVVHCHPKS